MMDNLPDYISPENFCTECPFQVIPVKRDCVNLRNMKFPRVTAALDGLRAIQTNSLVGNNGAFGYPDFMNQPLGDWRSTRVMH